jgi:HD-GYP domain-containing protein (c-di-GMP phosphodiesterase class II)
MLAVEPHVPAVKTELEPGDRLRRDLVNPQSQQILLPANTVLTPSFIRKIHLLGLQEEALRCIVKDFDAKRHAAAQAEQGVPFEYARFVEGKETIRVLLELAAKLKPTPQERDDAWDRATAFVSFMLEKLEAADLDEYPDMRIYDLYQHAHPLNTAMLSLLIGKGLGLDRIGLHEIGMAAIFADLGKARLPQELLYKPGRLTESETGWARTHAAMSCEIAEQFPWASRKIRHAAAHHHERFDGSGYPKGIPGLALGEECAIVGLADAYDAMISDVPYRKRMEPAIAFRLVSAGGLFNPNILNAFKTYVVPYPKGTAVKLSTGEEARVLQVSSENPYRPVVDVRGRIIELASDETQRIVSHLIPRRFSRTPVTYEARVTNRAGIEIACKAVDVSLGGICLEATAPPPQGEDLVVRLFVPNSEDFVTLAGHLLWSRHGEQGKSVFALSAVPSSEADCERLMAVLLEASGALS